MAENNISLEAIAEKHGFDIKQSKEYFAENGVRLSHNYVNGYQLPKGLIIDLLKYAQSQALNNNNINNGSSKWHKIYSNYFLKASEKLFGLAGNSAKTMSNYLKKQFKLIQKL